MAFQILLLISYAVQSPGALLRTLLLCAYIPILFYLACHIFLRLPIWLGRWLTLGYSRERPPSLGQYIGACIATPAAFIALSMLYFVVFLPLLGWTVHWLPAKDVIRATNGPAYYVFAYVVSPLGLYDTPGYYDETPQTKRDLVRAHIAAF